MSKKVLTVEWKAFEGAAVKRRMLKLNPNADGIFLCPVNDCLHIGFRSARGLRKHIETRHDWYFYFDKQPAFTRDQVVQQDRVKRKQSTHKVPAFSLDEGVGKDFLQWLLTPCGGGKNKKEAVQIGRRAMKFLMAALGDTEVETVVTEEYIDCCLGSPSVVISFLKTITEEWGLSSSAALTYLKSMCDLLDFRKANGVTDAVLRTFAVTEVYLRRGKDNLAKKKKVEYSRNLDLETLIARDSWATISDMEKVVPYHIDRYKSIVTKSINSEDRPTRSELAFATRFIVTFLFLRVKCSRPMTYQFITVDMVAKSKENGGYIDQTEFKTSDSYAFDTLILSNDVINILDSYITNLRPLMNPVCDFLLISTAGTQYSALTSAMTLLVKEAIGKYINPTRYRQIIETVSGDVLTSQEQAIISKDQKHSSHVAKRFYQKKLSRDIATQGRACMEKIVGEARTTSTQELATIVKDIQHKSRQFDEAVVEKARQILQPSCTVQSIDNVIPNRNSGKAPSTEHCDHDTDVFITGTVDGKVEEEQETPCTASYQVVNTTQLISADVDVKKEEAEQQVFVGGKNRRFTAEEDGYLKLGIQKYGKGNWSNILNDPAYKFNPARNRDSLRMRAETCAFKIRKNTVICETG